MAARGRALARGVALVAPLITFAAAGCSADREAASAPSLDTIEVAGSVAAAPASTPGLDVDRVAIVGDSITVGSSDELVDAFAAIGLTDVEINAESGRRMVSDGTITSGLEGVAAVLEEGDAPDLWVVALGTNDVANYPVEEYAGVITELLAALPADRPVVWVDCYLEEYQTRSAAFADTLRQVLAERGNATVVDWRAIAGEDGVLTDGVHPSDFGKAEFARRVADAVAAMG
jgi:lysophospholipase L1-like esterase